MLDSPISKSHDQNTGAYSSIDPARKRIPILPIKLLATQMDEGNLSKHTVGIRETLGFEGTMKNGSGIDWLVGFNYIVDWDYLMEFAPELVLVPRVTFFYDDSGSSSTTWWT
jgi:hypothetical protein